MVMIDGLGRSKATLPVLQARRQASNAVYCLAGVCLGSGQCTGCHCKCGRVTCLSLVVLLKVRILQLELAPILSPIGLLFPVGIPLLLEITLQHPLAALHKSWYMNYPLPTLDKPRPFS